MSITKIAHRAILTKVLPATDKKPARIKVFLMPGGSPHIVPWNHSRATFQQHYEAAEALAEKSGLRLLPHALPMTGTDFVYAFGAEEPIVSP